MAPKRLTGQKPIVFNHFTGSLRWPAKLLYIEAAKCRINLPASWINANFNSFLVFCFFYSEALRYRRLVLASRKKTEERPEADQWNILVRSSAGLEANRSATGASIGAPIFSTCNMKQNEWQFALVMRAGKSPGFFPILGSTFSGFLSLFFPIQSLAFLLHAFSQYKANRMELATKQAGDGA